jgi:hypothetical protein
VSSFLAAALLFGQREEMPDQVGQILDALAQRRQPQRHDVEAEEQVLAEQALLDQDAQVLVGRRDDAHVGLDRRAAADGGVFALLQHAQQPRLRLHRHVADLVEEQRAALGLLEAAGARVLAPVKAPFSWPNSSDSIRSRGIAAMLTATNGPLRRLP